MLSFLPGYAKQPRQRHRTRIAPHEFDDFVGRECTGSVAFSSIASPNASHAKRARVQMRSDQKCVRPPCSAGADDGFGFR